MLRVAFALAIVLASVSGSFADHRRQTNAPRGQAPTQTIHHPSGGGFVPSAPTVWGWPYRGQ
jgi:hypothetical protein